MYGYTGNILRVDLSNRTTTVDHPVEPFYRAFVGGTGLISYYLFKELKPGVSPLGPENKLVFAAGPLTGIPLPGGRYSVGAKSPLSGTISKAESGGFWGAELRRAGFDAVIVEGKASSPVYLYLHDGVAEVRDGSRLWGLAAKESQEAIRSEVGDEYVRVAQIGPAGEKLVRLACIVNDLRDVAGRTGLGAVMGSKNLKAIAVRGRTTPPVADMGKVKQLSKWMADNYLRLVRGMHELGTGGIMDKGFQSGNLPINNFRGGTMTEADAVGISAQALKSSGYRIDMEGCYACPVQCKKVVKIVAPYEVDPAYGGPEYESLAALGSNCGVTNLAAICKANEICNAYGMDTISTGVTIGFAMECFERGLLTSADCGGLNLRFGDADTMLALTEMIARRKGVGDLLAEGVAIASKRIGRGSEEFAVHIKGVEVPMHEPRLKKGLGINFATAGYGPDHMIGMHDTFYTTEGPQLSEMKAFGVTGPLPTEDVGPRKTAIAIAVQKWRLYTDSLVMCMFLPWSYQQTTEAVNAVTGWNTDMLEAMKVGERSINLNRLFNLREGLSAEDDKIPARLMSSKEEGLVKNKGFDPEKLSEAIHKYYEMMGWDSKTGKPSQAKLEELGIEWANP
ncbi:MAG: aldehyde ferredoxin oxidoreductase family protein [Chloroflexi bacterium]|nr:aldehyde ferredoxin oxidoreductase family protein [Chloroflexota bacterium]